MPIIGKGFNEISVKRIDVEGEIKLGHNENAINVLDIREKEISSGIRSKVLEVDYEFKSTYLLEEPKDEKFGEIKIKGTITYHDKEKRMKKILKGWSDKQKVEEAFLKEVLGRALYLSQIEAIEQSRKVMLPSPIPIPSLQTQKKKTKS